MELSNDQQQMLDGKCGVAKQMAMRLILDMAAAAGATELAIIQSAHLSGVSPLTGGMGLLKFLRKLASESEARVAVPTTLNAAGCDANQFDEMRIVAPDFLEQSREIVELYGRLGVRLTQSCIPYEWQGVVTEGTASWAESNAICFGNSYCGLLTNRESGLSALASSLTGYTPKYGLLEEDARRPNLEVIVDCLMDDPTDFSVLGDWIGKQRKPGWRMPYGPIPKISGLPAEMNHEQRKALSAAAANYGSPLLYLEGVGDIPEYGSVQASLIFTQDDLDNRYETLRPRFPVSLITVGCPQASLGELRAVANLLRGKEVSAGPESGSGLPPLWVFTSSANKAIAEKTGVAEIITGSGALLLENTCPEVVPYDQSWVSHILTNSMKAEHYIKSGLNGVPTSVLPLKECISIATGDMVVGDDQNGRNEAGESASTKASEPDGSPPQLTDSSPSTTHSFQASGQGLPSQDDFSIIGQAFVTNAPITLLGFVNRRTGVIEEPGHPADGQSLAGKIAIFPKGTGSTVAPYVLLELFYRGMAPLAIVNTEIDQQSAPACSLEGIPYAYDFDRDVIAGVKNNDNIELSRSGHKVELRVLSHLSDS